MAEIIERPRSFLLKKSLIHDVKALTDSQAGRLFMHILRFANGEFPEVEDDVLALYTRITDDIEKEWKKFNPKTGKYHWNYKGGITPENQAIRQSAEMHYWRRKVFYRDNYTCQHCGQRGGTLHAHHVYSFSQYPKLRVDVNNGLTLCKPCHNKVHTKQTATNGDI